MTGDEADRYWMQAALQLADEAARGGEVPVGAVLVMHNRLIGQGANGPIARLDPSAHAEILALRDAARQQGNYRLPGSTLYVTLEPCVMCAGAIFNARVARVVFAASDAKTGACGSVVNLFAHPGLNHHAQICAGVEAEASIARLRAFFAARRKAAPGACSPATDPPAHTRE